MNIKRYVVRSLVFLKGNEAPIPVRWLYTGDREQPVNFYSQTILGFSDYAGTNPEKHFVSQVKYVNELFTKSEADDLLDYLNKSSGHNEKIAREEHMITEEFLPTEKASPLYTTEHIIDFNLDEVGPPIPVFGVLDTEYIDDWNG